MRTQNKARDKKEREAVAADRAFSTEKLSAQAQAEFNASKGTVPPAYLEVVGAADRGVVDEERVPFAAGSDVEGARAAKTRARVEIEEAPKRARLGIGHAKARQGGALGDAVEGAVGVDGESACGCQAQAKFAAMVDKEAARAQGMREKDGSGIPTAWRYSEP